MCTCTECSMASDYNHLDDVPMSIRNSLAQSPAFSIITDNQSPEGLPQSHFFCLKLNNAPSGNAGCVVNSRTGEKGKAPLAGVWGVGTLNPN